MNDPTQLIALNIGNTRLRAGRFDGPNLQESSVFAHDQRTEPIELITRWWADTNDDGPRAIVIASVNDPVAESLTSTISDQLGASVYRIGPDVPVPIEVDLDPETITGVDRLLNAAAAWSTLEQACVIIDAGTAVTVDFVDGQGTFHGGAIAPGLRLQLQSLREHTAALPDVNLERPDPDQPFGRSTASAMLNGVYHGVRGMVWRLVERYAEAYEAYPTVIATGGDAELLFDRDDLIDRVAPDLGLLGIEIATRRALTVSDGRREQE